MVYNQNIDYITEYIISYIIYKRQNPNVKNSDILIKLSNNEIQNLSIPIFFLLFCPISCHWCLGIPPENIKRQDVFRGHIKKPVA